MFIVPSLSWRNVLLVLALRSSKVCKQNCSKNSLEFCFCMTSYGVVSSITTDKYNRNNEKMKSLLNRYNRITKQNHYLHIYRNIKNVEIVESVGSIFSEKLKLWLEQ